MSNDARRAFLGGGAAQLQRTLCDVLTLPEGRRPSRPELERAVRLLLACQTQRERVIVGVWLYQGRTLEQAAAAASVGMQTARDVCDALRSRVRRAEQMERVERALRAQS